MGKRRTGERGRGLGAQASSRRDDLTSCFVLVRLSVCLVAAPRSQPEGAESAPGAGPAVPEPQPAGGAQRVLLKGGHPAQGLTPPPPADHHTAAAADDVCVCVCMCAQAVQVIRDLTATDANLSGTVARLMEERERLLNRLVPPTTTTGQ